MSDTEVLIAGAGPTGLVLALWLTRQGAKVRVVDKTAGPGTTSRALAVQARTLELYRQLDLADAVVERGHKIPGVNLWVEGRPKARMPFGAVGADLTPYSFLEIFPQDQHERLLIGRLQALGVEVERETELLGFSDTGGEVSARLRGPGGREETCTAAYIAGCDGARSVVRETIGAGFPGGTYGQVFYVADVEAAGASVNGELHIDLDEADFLAVFPMAGEGRARLIGTVRGDQAKGGDLASLKFENVSDRAIRNLKIKVAKVNWFSTYHVHHRVADRFRKDRAFLLGDAAHIHSPAGGQGMNTGIGDAINLAWKLKAVLDGRAPDTLLESYEAERIGFARRLVSTTDKVFSFATAEGHLADILRTRVAPVVMPLALRMEAAREFVFRTVSQITVNYRGGSLSEGAAGPVHGGDRLPWAPADGLDNFDPLAAIAWQVHVYGAARPEVAAWCEDRGVALHAFDWRPAHGDAGLVQGALYLLRPDTYVALAEPSGAAQALERYFTERALRPG